MADSMCKNIPLTLTRGQRARVTDLEAEIVEALLARGRERAVDGRRLSGLEVMAASVECRMMANPPPGYSLT